IGDTATIERTLAQQDIQLFAVLSGDLKPTHIDPDFAASTRYSRVIAHGMWGGALISAVLGTRLPGPGTVYLGPSLRFLAPVRLGDRLTVQVTVTALDPGQRCVTLACSCTNQDGKRVIEGEAQVIAPDERIERARTALPEIRLDAAGNDGLARLLAHVAPMEAIRVAVVHPCDALSLSGAIDARDAGLIEPVLVGPRARIEAAAAEAGVELAGLAIEDVPHSHAAAARAVELAREGRVEALMKSSLHTDELMAAVVSSATGLRTKRLGSRRRVRHCSLLQTPHYPRPLIVTDAAVDLAPALAQKADIVRNAIELARVIGVARPKVATLAAVETVTPAMPATLDAAALCK